MTRAERIAACSIAVGCLVLGLKGVAWWITGSAALYSDALESVVNVAASVIALGAIHFAAQPADANHTYGHDKAELFSAAIEGGLIMTAALSILQHVWVVWADPPALTTPWAGLAVSVLATAVNAAWGAVLLRTGKRRRSPALVADGRHLFADVITSIGVIVGLSLAILTGIRALDPLLAALTALHILRSGYLTIRASVAGLMDEAPAPEIVERVRVLVREHAEGALEAHDLRMRHTGKSSFLEFHLVVPGSITVAAAHEICDRIEAALKAAVEGLIITIHVEPEAKAKHDGVLVV